MKKNVILLILLAISTGSYAQFEKGDIILGGGVSFSVENTEIAGIGGTVESDPIISYSLMPRVGYLLNETLEIGIAAGFRKWGYFSGSSTNEQNSTSIGIYGRKYFSLNDNLSFYANGGIDFGFGENISGSDQRDFKSASVLISPGLMFRASERIGVELTAGSFGYRSWTREQFAGFSVTEVKSSSFGFNFNLSAISAGVIVIF
ncbi:MAG: hypothetical protein ACNS60_09310 [Candidatus Cyclobacteriaceae bacterium M2_1C_046]